MLQPVVDVYRACRPSDSPSEIFVAIFSDRLREVGLRVAKQQSAHQGNVYVYNTTYQPLMDDDPNLGAFHGLESPLALRLVLHPDAERVSRQISGAWVSFARTGNPSHGLIPAWPTYHKDRATMTFDREPHVVYDPAPAERKAMSQLPHLGTPTPS
jgi:para-nitrobenzyl esterase